MTATTTAATVQGIDAALDQLQKDRERVLAASAGAQRSACMAELYELEARCWSVLFELTRTRVYWRAALAAEVGARRLARHWRRLAVAETNGMSTSARLGDCVEVGEWVDRCQAELAGGAS